MGLLAVWVCPQRPPQRWHGGVMSEGPSGLRSNPHRPLPSFLVSPSPRRAQHSHRAGAVRGSSCNEPATQGHSVTVGLYDYLGCECRDLSRQGCRWLVLPQPSPQPLRSGGGGRGGLAPPAGTPQVFQASSTRAAEEPRQSFPEPSPEPGTRAASRSSGPRWPRRATARQPDGMSKQVGAGPGAARGEQGPPTPQRRTRLHPGM